MARVSRVRFSLRFLFGVSILVSILLGYFAYRVEKNSALVEWVLSQKGSVSFNFENTDGGVEFDEMPSERQLLQKWLKKHRFKSVRVVNLSDTECTDINHLKYFRYLQCVGLENTQISDISSLNNMKRLEVVYLQDTNVEDIATLSTCKNLKYLNLQNSKVRDISPLLALQNLQEVILWDTKVSYEQIKQLLKSNPNCIVRHDFED